jgi:hypothetical protein
MLFPRGTSLSAPPSSLIPTTQLRLSPDGPGRANLISAVRLISITTFTSRWDGEFGSINIC